MEEEEGRPATLGDLQAMGLAVFCWCNRCFHNAELDVASLTPRFGPQQPVVGLAVKLRCGACGAKDVETRPAWRGLGQVTRHGNLR